MEIDHCSPLVHLLDPRLDGDLPVRAIDPIPLHPVRRLQTAMQAVQHMPERGVRIGKVRIGTVILFIAVLF